MINKKRLLIGFAFALIFSALIFVVATEGYLSGTTGSWTDYNEVTTLTNLTLNANQLGNYPGGTPGDVGLCNDNDPDVCSNGQPVAQSPNIVKVKLTDVNAPAGPIYFEVWKKSSSGSDVAVRTGTDRLVGVIRSNNIAIAPWSISLQDIVDAGAEASGNYLFYFKAITPSGYQKTYNVILNVTIHWDGHVINESWFDKAKTNPITSVSVDAFDIIAGTGSGPGGTNVVNMVALTNNTVQGTPVVFDIFDSAGNGIRTGLNGLVGVTDISKVAYSPWTMTLDDMMKATTNQFRFYGYTGSPYVSIANPLLTLNVDMSGFNSLISKWLDYLSNVITATTFSWSDLTLQSPASQSNSVYADLKGFPSTTTGQTLTLEIWSKDLLDAHKDKPIRTVAGANALTGTIDSNGELKALWKVNQADILNSVISPDNSYNFYYKIYFGASNNGVSYRNYPLQINVTGMQGVDITNAGGVWKNNVLTMNISQIDWGGPFGVVPYSWNVNAPQGTQIKFEIWRKHAGSDIPIRTVAGANALTGTVNSLEQAYPLWTILESDLDNTTTHNYFYFKIIYGSQTKSFDNVLLDVTKIGATCININYCMDYVNNDWCNQDACFVANATGGIYNIICSLPGMNCGCTWDAVNSKCNFIFTNQNSSQTNYGSCQYLESGNSSCQEGVMNLNWNGNWTWATGNNFANQTDCETSCGVGNCTSDLLGWHCDPQLLSTQCSTTSDSNAISCPAKVQLPGFNWINVVFIAIALVIIYFIIAWKRKSNKKKRR